MDDFNSRIQNLANKLDIVAVQQSDVDLAGYEVFWGDILLGTQLCRDDAQLLKALTAIRVYRLQKKLKVQNLPNLGNLGLPIWR